MKRLETAALAVIALSTASVIAIAQTAAPNAGSTGSSGAGSSGTSQQLSSADCQKVWDQVNPQAKASVSGTDLQSRVTDMKKVDANGDNMISSQEFTKACEQGYVKQAAASGSGSSGSGSSSGSSSGTSGSSTGGSSSGSSSGSTTQPSR